MLRVFALNSDNSLISPELQAIFERVRQSADFMPVWQMEVSVVILPPNHDSNAKVKKCHPLDSFLLDLELNHSEACILMIKVVKVPNRWHLILNIFHYICLKT